MTFYIKVKDINGVYKYRVELVEVNKREEIYRLIAKNKTLIFKNNRPFLQSKKLKHWKPTWSMEGELHNISFRDLIIDALNKAIAPENQK